MNKAIFLHNLLFIKSKDSETVRRGKILVYLLLGTLLLNSTALFVNLLSFFKAYFDSSFHPQQGMVLWPLVIIEITFVLLLINVKRGKIAVGSIILVSLYFIFAFYSAYRWGVDVPQALLMYSLTIILSGILLGSWAGFITFVLVLIVQFGLTYLQIHDTLPVESYWKSNFVDYRDTLVTTITLFIIAIVSWLSNREIERSLKRAQESEKALKKERDLLEIRVEERTKELRRAQLDRISQLYRFADLGKLASGLIHELVNPLTVVSLNLERIESVTKKENNYSLSGLQRTIKGALQGTDRINNYIQAARKQIQQQDISEDFSPCDEIKQVINIFSYKSKEKHVDINSRCENNITLHGNPIKFSQCISNLIANAIDSFQINKKDNKKITIITKKQATQKVIISISDNGKGISKKSLAHIFDPFFTTKDANNGTGIGLSMTKEIIENAFGGTIQVKSKWRKGTTFTIKIPTENKR